MISIRRIIPVSRMICRHSSRLVFVMVLSAVFCDIFWTKKNVLIMAGGICSYGIYDVFVPPCAGPRKKPVFTAMTCGIICSIFFPVSKTALCALLSNALENALRACGDDVSFDNGIPVTNRPGHGVGVKSICTIVQQYDGVYIFSVENGQFILRILI